MIAAGLVEAWLGIRAERKGLEELATPLSAEDAAEPARVRDPGCVRDIRRCFTGWA